MKLMSDPDLTGKVMAKLNGAQQPTQTAPSPTASDEEPEINSLHDAAK